MGDLRRAVLRRTAGAAALLAGLGAAASAGATTLADAISAAYAHNPQLQAQRAVVQQQDEQYVQARGGYGLQAQVSALAEYNEIRGKFLGPRDQFTGEYAPGAPHSEARTGTIDLTLSQPLFTGGRQRAAVNAAEASVLSAREQLRQTEISIVQQVISAYVGVRRDQQILDVYRDITAALARQMDQTRAEFAVRQVTQTDVDETSGRLAASQSNVASAGAQLEISRAAYLALVGEAAVQLDPEPALDGLPANLNDAFDLAEAQNANLRAAKYAEEAAKARVSEARRNYAPQLTLRVDVTRAPVEPYEPSLGDQHGVAASVNLTQPLYSSGTYTSGIRQELAAANQARFQVEQQRRGAVQGVSQAWAQLLAARAALGADGEGVRATQAAFYGVRREEPFGLRQPIDVLNAVLELNQAEIRFLQDRYNEYTARAGVLASAGVLEAALLVPDLDVIRPETHFNEVRNKGALPWEGLVRALDSVGVAPLHAPQAASRVDAPEHPGADSAPPAAPPAASTLHPFASATAIMSAEREGGPPPGAAGSARPLARCTVREAERTGCTVGGPGADAAPAAPTTADAPVATSPFTASPAAPAPRPATLAPAPPLQPVTPGGGPPR